jgi:Metallopeptidase family M24
MEQWRVYQDEPAPGILEVGLERVSERRRWLRRERVAAERVFARWFAARDRIASGGYRATLGQDVEHLARGTFGSYVDVDTLTDGVRVRLVRRTIGARHLAVAIDRERVFGTEDVVGSAARAPGGRSPLHDGFFHSLGHGVGLDVHEAPLLGRGGEPLVAGDVVTVEPGVYREGYGGVRLEDLFLVTDDGWERLTHHPMDLTPR